MRRLLGPAAGLVLVAVALWIVGLNDRVVDVRGETHKGRLVESAGDAVVLRTAAGDRSFAPGEIRSVRAGLLSAFRPLSSNPTFAAEEYVYWDSGPIAAGSERIAWGTDPDPETEPIVLETSRDASAEFAAPSECQMLGALLSEQADSGFSIADDRPGRHFRAVPKEFRAAMAAFDELDRVQRFCV